MNRHWRSQWQAGCWQIASGANNFIDPCEPTPSPARAKRRILVISSCPSETLTFAQQKSSRRRDSLLALWGLFLLVGCGTVGTDSTSSFISGDSLEHVSEKGPVKLVVRVTPKEPRLSDLVEMDVLVTAQSGVDIKPPAFGQAVGDFLVRDYTERSDPKSKHEANAPNVRRFVYKLEPVHAGRHLIRSLAIQFVDNRPLSEQKGEPSLIESEPFEVNVTSELGDQIPDLANLEPMLAPRPLSQSTSWNWFLAGLAVLTIVSIAILRMRKKKALITEPRRQTPEEIAHAAFATLLSENLPAKGLFKEFYLRLTGIVRNFIEGTTGLRAPEQTTEEFLRAMRSRDVFSADRSLRLKEFLEAADMVKYAGQQPEKDQIELSIARAREFVDFQQPVAVAAIEEA